MSSKNHAHFVEVLCIQHERQDAAFPSQVPSLSEAAGPIPQEGDNDHFNGGRVERERAEK